MTDTFTAVVVKRLLAEPVYRSLDDQLNKLNFRWSSENTSVGGLRRPTADLLVLDRMSAAQSGVNQFKSGFRPVAFTYESWLVRDSAEELLEAAFSGRMTALMSGVHPPLSPYLPTNAQSKVCIVPP
ncbi:hypothetical protein ACX80U_11450 [Arthrobacter sp. TmT3-37]